MKQNAQPLGFSSYQQLSFVRTVQMVLFHPVLPVDFMDLSLFSNRNRLPFALSARSTVSRRPQKKMWKIVLLNSRLSILIHTDIRCWLQNIALGLTWASNVQFKTNIKQKTGIVYCNYNPELTFFKQLFKIYNSKTCRVLPIKLLRSSGVVKKIRGGHNHQCFN